MKTRFHVPKGRRLPARSLLFPWFVAFCLMLMPAIALAAQSSSTPAPALSARVDPRVELMSIIFRLAGNSEYNMDNSESPYAEDVEKHFGGFRNHAAVRKAKQMRKDHQVGFDAVMNMAIVIGDTVTLKELLPLEQCRASLDQRWSVEDAREFLAAARSFVKDSDFAAFIAAHQPLYDAAGARMNEILDRLHIQKWFDSFFGARPAARFELILGLLNGGGSYGPSMLYPDGRAVYYSIIGCWRFDEQGRPIFSDSLGGMMAHEFCHSYANPLVERHLEELRPAGERMFMSCRAQMQQQAYSTWETMMRESLVRACIVRYLRANGGALAAAAESREQAGRGFLWVGELADRLGEYEAQRDHYPTLDTFMPKVIEFFDGYVKQGKLTAAQTSSGPDRVLVTPDAPAAGQQVKITYFALFGPLPGSKQMSLHYGFDKWQQVTDLPMNKPAEETWEVKLQIPASARQLDFVFTNGDKWDNNKSQDWHVALSRSQE